MSRIRLSLLSRRTALGAAGAAFATVFTRAVAAGQPPINTLRNTLFGGRGDTAIDGHDPVAYFTLGKAVKGDARLVTEWRGAKWAFASRANLDLFKADPERYAPQYGGYCAYGVAQGYLVKVDPAQFSVREGKLYLNYDAQVQARWQQDPSAYIATANTRFPALVKP